MDWRTGNDNLIGVVLEVNAPDASRPILARLEANCPTPSTYEAAFKLYFTNPARALPARACRKVVDWSNDNLRAANVSFAPFTDRRTCRSQLSSNSPAVT